nr:hypothetical protein [bacterium]
MKDQEFKVYWQKVRAKGRSRYILTRGMLLCGGIYLIGWSIMGVFVFSYFLGDKAALQSIINTCLAFAFGWLMGATLWKTKEYRYSMLRQAEKRVRTPWDKGFTPPDAAEAPLPAAKKEAAVKSAGKPTQRRRKG